MSQRLERLRARLLEKGYDGILVSQAENRRYLSGFTGSAGYLVITQKEAVLCTDFRYTEQAGLQAPEFDVRQIAGEYSAWLTPLVTDLQAHRLAFDAQHITVKSHTALQKAFVDTQVELLPDSETVEMLRAVKEPEEIAAVERAQALTDAAFIYVSNERMQPGMTENEVAWELERFIREHGGDGLAFDTIIAAGANSARPHHRAGETRIKAGEPIVMDFGAKVDGYCADMTRTICLGEQDDEFRRVYDLVLGAQVAAEALIKTGVTGEEADGYARKIIDEAGHAEHFGHSLGHGIGLYVHEYPHVAKRAQNVLEDGMIFSVEPGVYLTGWGGVRIEDLVVLESGTPRIITKAPK